MRRTRAPARPPRGSPRGTGATTAPPPGRRGPEAPAAEDRRTAAGTHRAAARRAHAQPQTAERRTEEVAAATAASPQAATAAKTPSADTATQIAAGASTRNGTARRATSSAPRRRRVTSTATGVVHPTRVRTSAEANEPPSPSPTRPTKSSSAPGGWPATWVGQLPGTPTGIRSANPLSRAGTSCTCRAVGRYSLWFAISWVRPDGPSTNARVSVHAALPAYVARRSVRHRNRAATAGPQIAPATPRTTASGVPGPTRGSTQPANGANGRTGCRLACTCQWFSGGTTTAVPTRASATISPPHAARSERAGAGTRSG